MDWFDLLAVQGTLQRLLQHHSLEASALRCFGERLGTPGPWAMAHCLTFVEVSQFPAPAGVSFILRMCYSVYITEAQGLVEVTLFTILDLFGLVSLSCP